MRNSPTSSLRNSAWHIAGTQEKTVIAISYYYSTATSSLFQKSNTPFSSDMGVQGAQRRGTLPSSPGERSIISTTGLFSNSGQVQVCAWSLARGTYKENLLVPSGEFFLSPGLNTACEDVMASVSHGHEKIWENHRERDCLRAQTSLRCCTIYGFQHFFSLKNAYS